MTINTIRGCRRRGVTAALVAVAAAVGIAGSVAGVDRRARAAAPSVEDVVRVEAGTFASVSPQQATAECPMGYKILGGGGSVVGGPSDGTKLTLTQLEPLTSVFGSGQHGFQVTGVETATVNTNWSVTAVAICARNVTGHLLVDAETGQTDSPMKATAARCPSGRRVLGSGARIDVADDHGIGLQVARASGIGDIARAQAHIAPGPSQGTWTLTAFAVCATTPEGYEVRYGQSGETGSQTVKQAEIQCTNGGRLVSAGAAITNVAPGNVSLQRSLPYSSDVYNSASARAVENTTFGDPWDFIVAQAICVREG